MSTGMGMKGMAETRSRMGSQPACPELTNTRVWIEGFHGRERLGTNYRVSHMPVCKSWVLFLLVRDISEVFNQENGSLVKFLHLRNTI